MGKPFQLLPWQKLVILGLFAVDSAGIRIIRWALIGVAKKNGKTELAAALGLYFLIGDGEPSPLVVVAASSEDQADYVFGAAATMCRMSPTLSRITAVYGTFILVPSIPGARLERVAAAAGTNDGKNIHVVICDELHEWTGTKGKQVWDVLTNGTGARRQPMVLQITTAGHDKDTVCGRQYDYGMKVLSGEIKDPRYFMYWLSAKGDHRKPAYWRMANPSWGVTIPNPLAFFADQLTKKTEAVFRRYFGNEWVATEEIWEVASLWDDLVSDLELSPELPAYVGIDVGLKHDSSAVIIAQPQVEIVAGEDRHRIVLRARVWENPYPYGTAGHDTWKFSIATVRNHLREIYAAYPAIARERSGPAFFYDKQFFEESAQELEADGLNMIDFPQQDARMVPVSTKFYELAKTGVLAHDGDEALRRHIRNVVALERDRGWRISKLKARRKVDAAIAAAIASSEASRLVEAPVEPKIHTFSDEEILEAAFPDDDTE